MAQDYYFTMLIREGLMTDTIKTIQEKIKQETKEQKKLEKSPDIIEIHADDRPEFWEVRGYHNDADPWREGRYSVNY